jgi:hypothetical protein
MNLDSRFHVAFTGMTAAVVAGNLLPGQTGMALEMARPRRT